jgi:hypothetical protein
MATELESWSRPLFTPGGGEPFLFYVVFGAVDTAAGLSSSTYRSDGVATGLTLSRYTSSDHAAVLDDFRQGYVWNEFQKGDQALATEDQTVFDVCLQLRGSPADATTLNYLRDSVGLLTFLLDQGGLAVYDPQMFKWWSPAEWRSRIFEPAAAVPTHHIAILWSSEDDSERKWFHTRGMRKFGRPDISIHNVDPEREAGVIDLCSRFIQLQAQGGIMPEGQQIRMASLPSGGLVHHRGDLDDPDFNNVHIEISWPTRP